MPATKYTRYNDIPQLTRGGSWECDFNLDEAVRFVRNKDEQVGLDLDPDFQRGHVWNEAQQIAWLEFFIRGGKTGRVLYFNQPSWMMRATTAYDDFVIVDGKQRYKAIERFIGGEIKVYGSYVGEYTDSLRCTHTLKINVNNFADQGGRVAVVHRNEQRRPTAHR